MITNNELQKLGISHNESIVLLRIIQNPNVTVTSLIETTGMNRKVIYDAMRRLIKANLITSKKEGKERKFSFGGEESLQALIAEEKQILSEKEQEIKKIIEKINKIIPNKHSDAMVFSGTRGVRIAFNILLSLKADYIAYGGPLESETLMTETFWLNLHQKQKELGIKIKLLFNESLRKWIKKIDNPKVKLKFLPEVNPISENIICKDHVITIIWTDDPIITITINEEYAKSQMDIFRILWDKGSKTV